MGRSIILVLRIIINVCLAGTRLTACEAFGGGQTRKAGLARRGPASRITFSEMIREARRRQWRAKAAMGLSSSPLSCKAPEGSVRSTICWLLRSCRRLRHDSVKRGANRS